VADAPTKQIGGCVAMPLPLSLLRSRRMTRPAAPSCRGGASSLLRLAQPGPRAGDPQGWMQRAAATLSPLWPASDAPPSIITRLTPSRELAPR
jgi:hypothetical protein